MSRSTRPGVLGHAVAIDFNDLAAYVQQHQAGGYPVTRVSELVCRRCGGRTFAVDADDTEGCAQARCLACHHETYIADSAEHADAAELVECACPCGGEAFTVAIGFALFDDGDVRWISLGLHCVQDDTLGVYADWKIDYSPTGHLLTGW